MAVISGVIYDSAAVSLVIAVNEVSDESPDWSLLPQRPIEFFRLEPGFDRKALKRAYNHWLRQYKPDKYPDQFQKLRAAYELLDSGLRYNQDTGQVAHTAPMWDTTLNDTDNVDTAIITDHHSGKPTQPKPRSGPTLWERLAAELAVQPPQQVYRTLKQQGQGTPEEFYALAILSDAEHAPKELIFFKWILRGLQKHPNEPTLLRLLHSYLQSDQVPDELVARVLVVVSRVLNTDRFYYYTERLFDRLLDTVDWNQFQSVFDECGRNIKDHMIRGRIIFLCHILRRVSWKAPIEAVQAILSELDRNAEYLYGMLEYEFEFNSRLVDYVRTRETFIRRGPTCQRIDQALRMACVEPGDAADAMVVACQAEISQNPESLFEEIPLLDQVDDINITCWIWLSDEVQDRLETQPQPIDDNQPHPAVMKLLVQIDAQFPKSSLEFFNLLRLLLLIGCYLLAFMISLVFMPITYMLPDANSGLSTTIVLAAMIALVIAFHLKIKSRTTDKWVASYLERLVWRNYRDWWRPMIARFQTATHLSFTDILRSSSDLVTNQHQGLNVSTWFPQFYGQDFAMLLHATAVRFLR